MTAPDDLGAIPLGDCPAAEARAYIAWAAAQPWGRPPPELPPPAWDALRGLARGRLPGRRPDPYAADELARLVFALADPRLVPVLAAALRRVVAAAVADILADGEDTGR